MTRMVSTVVKIACNNIFISVDNEQYSVISLNTVVISYHNTKDRKDKLTNYKLTKQDSHVIEFINAKKFKIFKLLEFKNIHK